jgi:hypothetical protein
LGLDVVRIREIISRHGQTEWFRVRLADDRPGREIAAALALGLVPDEEKGVPGENMAAVLCISE